MKIAITGLSGFLGSFVAAKLYQRGDQVRALVRSTSNVGHLKCYEEKFTYLQGDLTDRTSIGDLVKDVDIVIHMAYQRDGTSFRDAANRDCERFLEANLLGSLELLRVSKERGVKQFIFISSCAVYGYIFPGAKLDERHPLLPESDYGAYKASVEAFCHAQYMTKVMDITIFRPVGIYGVNPHVSHSRWYGLIRDIKGGADLEVSGGGKIVHGKDVAEAIYLAVDNKGASGKVYNLVDIYMDNLSIAQMAAQMCASKSKIRGTPKKPINTMENGQSKMLGVSYVGRSGLRGYIQELLDRI